MKNFKWKKFISASLALVMFCASFLGAGDVYATEETVTEWVDMEVIPELGPDIGDQSRGKDILTAVIVDENTPMLLSEEGSSCTIIKGQSLPYMTWTTHLFSVNSETGSYPAYCMEPSKGSPSGAATVSVLENDTIKALMLCAYEGPYPLLSTSALEALGVPLERAKQDVYCITHACVSYVYCGSLQGVNSSAAQDYINHIKTVQKWASEHPDIMEQYTAYVAYSDNQQDICWMEKTGVEKGQISMQKVSANTGITNGNNCYSLAGAVYGVYDKDSNLITQMTTDAQGQAVSEEIPYGTYWLKEITAPSGFALSESWSDKIELNASTVSVTVQDIPQNDPISIVLGKLDAETTKNMPQGSASLAGAEFTIKYYSGNYDSDPQAAGIQPVRTWVLRTDDKGICKLLDSYKVSGDAFYRDSNGYETFPLGTVTVQETKAPEGYLLNTELFVRQITSDGIIEPVDTYNAPEIPEQIIKGGVSIEKRDLETNEKISQGDASLEGAEFTIMNRSENPVVVSGKSYAAGEAVMTIVTDAEGVASTESNVLPYGAYEIKETKSPEGYLLSGTGLTQTFAIRENGVTVKLNTDETAAKDQVIRGGVAIEKWDAETKEKKPQGSATLKGAEFTITTQSEHPVIVDGKTYEKGEVVMVFVTGADGMASTKTDALPYGTYRIKETKAPDGYLPVGKNLTQDFEVRENGVLVQLNTEDTAAQNEIKRGDLQLIKAEDGTLSRMAEVKFSITSNTTGESHIFVTDENGYYNTSSEWNPHTSNTNRGESGEDGIWFGTSEPDNKKGALLYDTYTIVELPCDANEGHKLVKFDVVIHRDHVTVDLGTVTDDLIPVISICTMATDQSTGRHESFAEEQVTICDKVLLTNLAFGKEYTLKGVLMDKETGKPLLVDGKEVTAEKTFTAESENSTETMEFTFDASSFIGKEVVVFEKLYQDGQEAAIHEDLEDEDQTIRFHNPQIKTKASDAATGTQEGSIGKEVTILDKVSYTGLIVGKTYVVEGILMDQETGEPLLVNGKKVTAKKEFTAEKESGSVELSFTFDGSLLGGKAVVVFEKLFYGEKEIACHEDLTDKDQTVSFEKPEIKTSASDQATGTKEGIAQKEVTIVDKVQYFHLIVGKEYVIKGVLMDKETGKPFLVDGKEVCAEKTFIAEGKEGSVELSFTFDGSGLDGKEIVVFEKLYHAGVEIASHEDLADKDQTVSYKKPEEKTVTITSQKPTTTISAPKPVKTGDTTNIAVYLALAVVALAGIAVFCVKKRKNRLHEVKRINCKKQEKKHG